MKKYPSNNRFKTPFGQYNKNIEKNQIYSATKDKKQ